MVSPGLHTQSGVSRIDARELFKKSAIRDQNRLYEREDWWRFGVFFSFPANKCAFWWWCGEIRWSSPVGFLEVGAVIKNLSGVFLFPFDMFYVFLTNKYTEDKNYDDDDGACNPIALIEQQHNSELAFHLIAPIYTI